METQTLPSHSWHLSANLYVFTLCYHLPWYDSMHIWPQEERVKGETILGQVMGKHLKQGHSE